MKAVMPQVPADVLAWRKRTGADQWDEMWEGVLHMPPAPNLEHQDLEGALETWLRQNWVQPGETRVYHHINVAPVGGWPDDYRIPDLVLLGPDCTAARRGEYLEGAPTAVVEIHSPGGESFEKFPFYAELGAREVWIIDRDTRVPLVYALRGGEYEEVAPGVDGWIASGATGIQLRAEAEDKVALQIGGAPHTRHALPEE